MFYHFACSRAQNCSHDLCDQGAWCFGTEASPDVSVPNRSTVCAGDFGPRQDIQVTKLELKFGEAACAGARSEGGFGVGGTCKVKGGKERTLNFAPEAPFTSLRKI